MDITALFKACIKTEKLHENASQVHDKNRILKNTAKNDFVKEAKKIRDQVTQLRNVLIENRAGYLEFACHLKDSQKLSDSDRDTIDANTLSILSLCLNLINDFRLKCKSKKPTQQFAQHLDGVIDLLMDYLKAVEGIHKQLREYRVQRQLETYKFLKLGAGKKTFPKRPSIQEKAKTVDAVKVNGEVVVQKSPLIKRLSTSLAADDEELNNSQSFIEEEEMSPEDIQILEQENKRLYVNLQGLSDEIEQISKKVVDIAKLQDIFTEKVDLQKFDIEKIETSVINSTENVKDANEQIKQAIQRNAGLRVYILFFLLVMTFTLLFLDWYND